MSAKYDVIVVGGGAAGFYAAIHIASGNTGLKVAILERGKSVLSKVKVSGGGRCNVTHAEFDPGTLVKNYPRGEKELLGPFHTYCTGDTMAFFEERGVPLKIEEDGRMFPVSDSSQSIIDCFTGEADRLGVQVLKHSSVTDIVQLGDNGNPIWEITTIKHAYTTKKIVMATGSNPKIWTVLKNLGHTIVAPTPSLFTFNIKDERINGIPGLSTPARVSIMVKRVFNPNITITLRSQKATETLLEEEGPVLITHWGLSGPAILRLSAWGAKVLNEYGYRFKIRVNWLPDFNPAQVLPYLMKIKEVEAKKTVLRTKAVNVPRRLWTNLVQSAGLQRTTTWADVSKVQLQNLTEQLTACTFQVDGKSTFKEEFVTAGGVDLKEVNFKTMESKVLKNVYFAGEIMNVDAITGGFNFQNAWTSAYVAAQAIVKR